MAWSSAPRYVPRPAPSMSPIADARGRPPTLAPGFQVGEQPLKGRRLAQEPPSNLAHLVDLILGQLQPGLDSLEVAALGGILQVLEGDLYKVRASLRAARLPGLELVSHLLHLVERDPVDRDRPH